MRDDFRTVRVERSELIAALLGEYPKSRRDYWVGGQSILSASEVMLIFDARHEGTKPFALVVSENQVQDFFAWLETYGQQFFPVTQRTRVFSEGDFEFFSRPIPSVANADAARAMAGLIVGELLGQSSGDPASMIESASLSLAQATYSFAYARSSLLWGREELAPSRLDRCLEDVGSLGLVPERRIDASAVRAVFLVADLIPGGSRRYSGGEGIVGAALSEIRAQGSLDESTILRLARYFEPARELLNLARFSAEDRVHLLDRMIDFSRVPSRSDLDRGLDVVGLFCIAYAAVEIGGGTTRHMGLLVPIAEARPIIWMWFGLIASIGPQEKWQAAYARLGRLVTRELTYSFDVTEAPRSDIALGELKVHRGSRKKGWTVDVPRMQSRTISVELLPGVPLHVSVVDATPEKRHVKEDFPVNVDDVTKLDQAIEAIWNLRQKLIQRLSGEASTVSELEQPRKSSKRVRDKDLFRK